MTIIATLLSVVTWTHLVGTPAEGPVRAESECAEAGQDLEGASWSEALGGLPAELTGDARLVSVVAYGTGEHLNARTSELWTLLEARTSGPLTRAMGLPDHLVAAGPDRVAVYLEEKYSSPSRTIALYQAGENEPLTVQVWYARGGEAKRCGKYVVRLRAAPTALEFDSELERPRREHLKVVDFEVAPPRATTRLVPAKPPVGGGFLLTTQYSAELVFPGFVVGYPSLVLGMGYHKQAPRIGFEIGGVGQVGLFAVGGGLRLGLIARTERAGMDDVGLELMGLLVEKWFLGGQGPSIAVSLSISFLNYYWRRVTGRVLLRGGAFFGGGYLGRVNRETDVGGSAHRGFLRIGYTLHFGML